MWVVWFTSRHLFSELAVIVIFYIPYPFVYNHEVLFFNIGFWVMFNSKNPSKSGLFDQKMGFNSRKTQKTGFLKKVRLYSRVGLYTSGYSSSVVGDDKHFLHTYLLKIHIMRADDQALK